MKELIDKFKFKEKATVINVPVALEREFIKPGFKSTFTKNEKSANTLVFINNKNEFIDFLSRQLKNTAHDGVLWFAYSKGTSKIKTDINRDTMRVAGEEFKITTVIAVSINDTWSALRFRPIEKVGK